MKERESLELSSIRWEKQKLLQEHYSRFSLFLDDVMHELGFSTSDIQHDIGAFFEHGPQYLQVQAQRGQAKTTIAAAFAVYCLIHSPAHRVLVVSAGGTQANEISTLIVRIIMTMDVLEHMRPDKAAGDKTSTEAFDIHHSLKGTDKSPSVACVGIGANLQGKRADLLIADDVESTKNASTPTERAKLLALTKDFTSICSTGRILYLGTPQTLDSIYNTLPSRGFTIRIWPGRYPTPEQIEFYQNRLAPLLLRRIQNDPSLQSGGGLDGKQGKAIDPLLLDEAVLQHKELDQGPEYFQLQHMLNTTLSDAGRYPLNPTQLVVVEGAGTTFPRLVVRGMDKSRREDRCIADFSFQVSTPQETSRETAALQNIVAYVDPAAGGANGDETGYAIGGQLNSKVIVLEVGGIAGGYTIDKLNTLAGRLSKYDIKNCIIEKNMGHGAFSAVFTPVLRALLSGCGVSDDLVTGQKERRIIGTLGPVMGRGALVLDPNVFVQDAADVLRYPAAQRQFFSLFYQMAKITSARGCLIHDDRLDALEGLVRHFVQLLKVDEESQHAKALEQELAKLHADPLGHYRTGRAPTPVRQAMSMLRNFPRNILRSYASK